MITNYFILCRYLIFCLGVLSILTAGVFIADLAWKLKHTKFESKWYNNKYSAVSYSLLTTISAANKFIAAIFGNLYTSWCRPLICSLYYLETGCKWEMCFRNRKRSESRAKMQPHHCSDFIRGAGLKLFYDTSKKQEFTAPRCWEL